jgi:hypothetical protein
MMMRRRGAKHPSTRICPQKGPYDASPRSNWITEQLLIMSKSGFEKMTGQV